MPLRIYIAGPYTAATRQGIEANVNRAMDAGIAVFRKGHYPYIPHLTDLIDRRAKDIGESLTWNDFIKWDMPWLSVCDAILYLGKSNGADLELKEAKRLGKRVFYAIDEIPDLLVVERSSG